MSDERIAPERIEAAKAWFNRGREREQARGREAGLTWEAFVANEAGEQEDFGWTLVELCEQMEAAIRAADEERGLKKQSSRCNCYDGLTEEGPPGATYSAPHERCGATGWVIRLASDWLPMERPS